MPSSSRRPSPIVRTFAALALGLSVALLSGCSLLEGPTPSTPVRTEVPEPEQAPVLVPGGSAEDNLPFFTETLRAFTESEQPVKGQPVTTALIEAGFDKALMQVSFDTSKTGLDADNIFVSVRYGEDCLIGQVVAEDRSFVAKNEPALGPDKSICLIGNTNPITW